MLSSHRGQVDEVVVCLLGDLVEGIDIYPGQNVALELGAFAQTRRCADALWLLLVDLVKELRCPVRVVAVPGNHGRQSKTAARADNWDNVVTYVLSTRAEMHGDKRLRVVPSFAEFDLVDVKGHRVVLNHTAIKHAGTPAMQARMAAWLRHHDAEIIMHGHWHNAGVSHWMDRLLVSNGSLCGPDPFGERHALISPARQVCFLVAPGEEPWGYRFLGWGQG